MNDPDEYTNRMHETRACHTRERFPSVSSLCLTFLLSSACLLHSAEMSVLVRRYEQAEIFSNDVLQNTDRERILGQCESVQNLAESLAGNTSLKISNREVFSSCLNSIIDLVERTDHHVLFPIDTTLVKVRLKVNTEESIRDEIHGIPEWYPFACYEGFLPAELYLRLVLFNTCIKNEMGAQFVVSDAFRPWTLSSFYFMDPDFGSAGLKAPVAESNGHISRGSRHNKGEAIDVYLIDVTGNCIEYPGQPCYHRTVRSATVDGKALYEFVEENKTSVGLKNVQSERTHFQLASGDHTVEYAAEFPGFCLFGKCWKDVTVDGVLIQKNTLVKIMDMHPNHTEVRISVVHGQYFDTVHSIPRKHLLYPYMPVVAELREDIRVQERVVAKGTLVEFGGVGHNDSLRQVQLLNDTLLFMARIDDYGPSWRFLPYDSIGVIRGPMGERQRGGVLHINDANRNWVESFTELRRKRSGIL